MPAGSDGQATVRSRGASSFSTLLLFVDEARTRALVPVRVGGAGGEVLLEKHDGAWKAANLTHTWVE